MKGGMAMGSKPLTFSWKDEPATYCDADTINQKITECEELEKKGKLRKIPYYTSKNFLRLTRTYCIAHNKHSCVLRVYINSEDHYQYMFNENRGTSVSEQIEITGQQAYVYIEELFQDIYGDDKTLFRAFSGIQYKEEYNAIKNCVPKPVSMINNLYKECKVKDAWKADKSSAYPSEGSKSLPTLHQCKQVGGYVEPTEEYPFAFYLNSHHMSVYKEFDTRKWCKFSRYYTLYDDMFRDWIRPEEEITLLCKRSPYSLAPVFSKVYQDKLEGKAQAKLGMVAAIGMFQKTNNPRLSHLAAVIIGRCADEMLSIAHSIEKQNKTVLLIATDSIIWTGGKIQEATDSKFLGSFTYEIHGGMFYGVGSKAYQVINDLGECVTKYSGMKNSEEKNKLPFGTIPSKTLTRRYIINDDGKVEEVNWTV